MANYGVTHMVRSVVRPPDATTTSRPNAAPIPVPPAQPIASKVAIDEPIVSAPETPIVAAYVAPEPDPGAEVPKKKRKSIFSKKQ